MTVITLLAPRIEGQTVTFSWHIEPATQLYSRPSFTLTFPPTVPLGRVPARLWLDIALICLHPHWVLLAPCVVKLPYRLGPDATRFWLELMLAAAETLDSIRAEPQPQSGLGVTLVDGTIEIPHERVSGNGYATAFSSGKDSLLQASLLLELTERPLLVTTTSPMPPLADHVTGRRRRVLAAIQERRSVDLVEVESDLRANWDNGFAGRLGYPIAINELTDTFLYMSSLLAVSAALGRTHLFVASEAEVQENTEIGGRIVQHPHFMYSAATQRALSRYLSPYGLTFGSLIWPLYSMQVQQLLWARYPDLSDLQYSCWRVGEGQSTCSACEQCLRIAMTAIAAGHNPELMGIDLDRLMDYAPQWSPVQRHDKATQPARALASQRALDRVVGTIRSTSPGHFAAIALKSQPLRLFRARTLRTLRGYRALRARVGGKGEPPAMGYRVAFVDWLDPTLRDRLSEIFASHFPAEPAVEHRAIAERTDRLVERATAHLDKDVHGDV